MGSIPKITSEIEAVGDFVVDDDLPPHIKPGKYNVMLDWFQTAMMFQGKAPKLIMWFAVVSHGDAYGKRIPRYYNVKRVIGKPQKGGRFQVSKGGDFIREYLNLFHYDGGRLDRLPMTRFQGVVIQAEISTVKNSRGIELPEPLRYSKIARFIKVVEE